MLPFTQFKIVKIGAKNLFLITSFLKSPLKRKLIKTANELIINSHDNNVHSFTHTHYHNNLLHYDNKHEKNVRAGIK